MSDLNLSATESLAVRLGEAASVATRSAPVAVEMELDGSWVDVTADVLAPMRMRYGAWGTGPLDRVSSTGTCEFSLRNSSRSSGGVVGYYSPGHTNCRSGFERGIRFRIILTHDGQSRQKFTGKISSIDPHGGLHGDQQTSCVAVDWMDELANFDAREIDPQESKRSDELLTTLVAAMPTDAQPVAQSFSTGVDTFTYTWTNLGGGRNGLSLAADVVRSDFGYLHVHGDGTLRFYDRHDESSLVDTLTLTDATLRGIRAPSSFDQTYNAIRVTVHPKRVPPGTIVLWTKATEDAPLIPAGDSVTLWVTYRDPTNDAVLIGGQSGQFVTPVSPTDYAANAASDGSGADLTSSITITATFFATTAKLVIANASASDAYMTTLQVRGKGIYDLDAVTMESASTQGYGRRVLDVDMPYAEDANVAQDIANSLRAQFDSIVNYVTEIEIRAHYSSEVLSGVLALEPGLGVTVTESMTGVTSRELRIKGVELVIMPPGLTVETARFAVSPRTVSDAGILDDTVRGLLDSTFILGAF